MAKTILNVKTDKEVKEQSQEIARELGVPLSTVVNAYLKEFIRTEEVRLSLAPRLRPEIGKMLKRASEEYRKRKNVAGPFTSAKEALAHLKS